MSDDAVSGLVKEFTTALDEYLQGAGETALQRAYELGRKAIANGLGILDMAAIYQATLTTGLFRRLASPDGIAVSKAAAVFFSESLTPFEMTHRSFQEAHVALRASEERYRELFENASDIVFTLDLDGNFTSINRAGEEISGYGREEICKMDLAQLLAPEYVKAARKILDSTVKRGGRTAFETEIVAKDGRRVVTEIATRPIYEDGSAVGVQGIARDITARKRAEEAMQRMNEALEEETKRIAHALHDESGQLLVPVYIALEEVAGQVPPSARESVQKVKRQLDQIEEQLRRFSHELRPTILDDLGLLPAVQLLAQGFSRRTGIMVAVDSTNDRRFPPPLETAVYRIIQEALTNVARHAKASQVNIRIRPEAHLVRGSVRDDGTGFDMASALERKGAHGLGVIGIRARLDALGGTFSLQSTPGQGSELQFTIPLECNDAGKYPIG